MTRTTPHRLAEMKAAGEPIVMITAYDFPSGLVAEEAGVDVVLVGDSAATTVLGHDSTVPIGMTELLVLAAAVRRGARNPLLVGDLPFGSYEASNALAVQNAVRFVKEAGCDAVKLERGGVSAERARAIVRAGIPVMGHVGLTPQSAVQLGGLRAQGRTAMDALNILESAGELREAGCFALVFEAIPAEVTELLMSKLELPVIGIGAGGATDGQVLVLHDLLGMLPGRMPRFVKKYGEIRAAMLDGVARYAADVRSRQYPGPEHTYSIDSAELESLRKALNFS